MRLWMYKFFIANKLKPSLRIDPRPCVEITRLTNYAPALPKHTDCRFDLVLDLRVLCTLTNGLNCGEPQS